MIKNFINNGMSQLVISGKRSVFFVAPCLAFSLSACMKVSNSSSGDYVLENSSLSYVGAYNVMKEKCFSCHREFNTTQANLISAGYVVPGSPLTSSMYYRLQGSEGGGVKNMPQTGALTAEDRKIIKDWIQSIN